MDLFFEPHRVLLKKLLELKVEFIMVGGYAVNYYGYNRPTADMDLLLKPTEENKNKFLKVLKHFRFDNESIHYVKSLDLSNPEVFSIGKAPVKIDFLTRISGVSYKEADQEKIVADIEDMKIPILTFNHLILSKISNDRTKDKLDIEELQKIQQKKNDK